MSETNGFKYGWAEELGRALAGKPNQDDINPKTGKPWRTTAETRANMSASQRLRHQLLKIERLKKARAGRSLKSG